MTAAAEIQALLRFLSQDAKVPLAVCLPKVGELRNAQLGSAENIAKSDSKSVSAIFRDEKVARQVFNAAKRVTNPKKRPASETATITSSKLVKALDGSPQPSEAALELTPSELEEDTLSRITLQTNRAPLVLAFALTLLKYTMPDQPVSSRLSLAQAIVSANSQSKAKSIGIISDNTAEEEGWANGQPKIKIMGRAVAVMRRAPFQDEGAAMDDTQTTIQAEEGQPRHEAYWGLDLDALRKSNGPLAVGKNSGTSGLPIYTPESARNYLLRSMTIVDDEIKSQGTEAEPGSNTVICMKAESPEAASPRKKPTAKQVAAKKAEAAAALLQALDLLCSSWAHLGKDDLDRRAWSWYLHVRPDVAQGQPGWGQKGQVKLADILKLRQDAVS